MKINLLHSRIAIGDKPLTGFVYCDEREQRVSRVVCQNNVNKGRCAQDFLKCQKASPEITIPAPISTPEGRKDLQERLDQMREMDNRRKPPETGITPEYRNAQLDLFGGRKATE